MSLLRLACALLVLASSSLPFTTPLTPPPPPTPRTPSTAASLAALLPAISSALHDLAAVEQSSADGSLLRLARRHFRFVLSGLSGPLQLLDWSHWSADPFASAIHQKQAESTGGDDWLAEEEDGFALHGDPSHVLRTAVNAHKRAVAPHTSHRSNLARPLSPNYSFPLLPPATVLRPPTPIHSAAAVDSSTGQSTASAASTADVDTDSSSSTSIGAPEDTCTAFGRQVRFTRYSNVSRSYQETTLCYCPADFYTFSCGSRRPYRCQLRLTADITAACTTARYAPPPTLWSSHTVEGVGRVHLNDGDTSTYFTYEPWLSGPAAPCVTLADERSVLDVNFTCNFLDDHGANTVALEGFDPVRLANRLRYGWVLNDTLPEFTYAVKNVDNTTAGGFTFAVTGAVHLSIAARLHNTAHPSQWRQAVLPLTAAQLQQDGANEGHARPLTVLTNTSALERNLRRGGRLLLALSWYQLSSGLVMAGSGLPWQLTVEDGTWVLPRPSNRLWTLNKWQTAAVVVAAVVLLLLLVWRWWQQRQTEQLQALLAEQRGKQQSWFVASR